MSIKQFSRCQHSHTDIGNGIRCSADRYKRETVMCCHSWHRFINRCCRSSSAVVTCKECRHHPIMISLCCDHRHRIVQTVSGIVIIKSRQERHAKSVSVAAVNGHDRLIYTLSSEFIAGMILDKKRIIFEFFNAFHDSLHRCLSQRANSSYPILLHDLIAACKNAWTWKGKINDFLCRTPRFEQSTSYFDPVRVSVCRIRPYDLFSVISRDQEEPFSCGRCAVVTSAKQTIFHMISVSFKLSDKPPECFSLIFRIRLLILIQSPPVLKFLYIFQHDYTRMNRLCPLHSYPGQTSYLL